MLGWGLLGGFGGGGLATRGGGGLGGGLTAGGAGIFFDSITFAVAVRFGLGLSFGFSILALFCCPEIGVLAFSRFRPTSSGSTLGGLNPANSASPSPSTSTMKVKIIC